MKNTIKKIFATIMLQLFDNVINLAESYVTELDQKFTQGSLTGELETEGVKVSEVNGKIIHVPTNTLSGMKNHNRNGGWNKGDVKTEWKSYEMDFDRDISYLVDTADVQETNGVAGEVNVMRTFMDEVFNPEIDAYRLSKLATYAITNNKTDTTALTTDNIYAKLKAGILGMRKYGSNKLICYISGEAMDLLEQCKDFTRKIDVVSLGTDKQGNAIETRVTSIDGVKLKEVYDTDRFYTEFDFTEGFVPTAEASAINFLIVAKNGIIAKKNISSMYLKAPGEHTEGDGYWFASRIYHDIFQLENKKDTAFVSYKVEISG